MKPTKAYPVHEMVKQQGSDVRVWCFLIVSKAMKLNRYTIIHKVDNFTTQTDTHQLGSIAEYPLI